MAITNPLVGYLTRPIVRPLFAKIPQGATLYTDFAKGIYKVDTTFGNFGYAYDITRASSKYVWQPVNAQMQLVEIPPNEPAFAYDPVTGEALGLSVEGSAVNLATQTAADANALSTWTQSEIGIAVVADDNFGSVIELTDTAANSQHYVGLNLAATSADKNRSVYVKMPNSNGNRYIALSCNQAASADVNTFIFDMQDGLFTQSGSDEVFGVTSFEEVTDGWYRIDFYSTDTTTSVSDFAIAFSSAPTGIASLTYSGAGSKILIALPQVESGQKPTSPIPTTTSTLTRDADIVTSDAATFGDWYRTSGTLTVTAKANVGDIVARLGSIEITADVDTEKEYSVTYTTDPLATELELLPSGNGYIKQDMFKE